MPKSKAKNVPLPATQTRSKTKSKSKQSKQQSSSPSPTSPTSTDDEIGTPSTPNNDGIVSVPHETEQSDDDSEMESCYDELELKLPLEGKTGPSLDRSTLMDLLAAKNKENILLMQSTIRQTLTESTNEFRKEITTQLASVKTDLEGLIDNQKKQLDTFKTKFDDRLTNLHSMVKLNTKNNEAKMEEIEKKVNNMDLKLVQDKNKVPDLISTMNQVVIDQCLGNKTEMMDKLSKIEESLKEQKASAEFIARENDDLKKKLSDVQDQLKSAQHQAQLHEIEQNRQQADIEDLKAQGQSYDLRQCKLNLIFEGLPEKKNEYPKQVVHSVLESSEVFDEIPDFDAAYRLGKKTEDSCRPILVALRD